MKNFNNVLINVSTSKKNKFIIDSFFINGLFSIDKKTILDNNIELFLNNELKVYLLVEKKYYELLNKNLINSKDVQILIKENFDYRNVFNDNDEILVIEDNFYFNEEIFNYFLTNSKYNNLNSLIQLNYNNQFDFIGIFNKNLLSHFDFKNNSISTNIRCENNFMELEENNYAPIKVSNYETLIQLDKKYECDQDVIYFTPGPVQIRDEVREVLGKYVNHHRSLSIKNIYKEAAENIKWAFNSKKAFPIAMANTGLGAIESCFVNLLEKGDEILILSNGFFGNNLIDTAKRHELNPTLLEIKQGEIFDLDEIRELIKNKKAVFVVHMDTSCGVLNPIKEIGNLCKENNCLFIVDAISTILNEEFNFDEYGITAAVCTSGKGFEVSPGLAFLCVSEQGMEISKNNKKMKPKFLDWQTFKNRSLYDGFTPSTYPINIFSAINKVCNEIREEGGLTRLLDKKYSLNLYLSENLISLGFEHLIKDENSRSNWVLVLKTPEGIYANELRTYLYVLKNTLIECGILDDTNRIIRLAISATHNVEDVGKLIEAIKEYINLNKEDK